MVAASTVWLLPCCLHGLAGWLAWQGHARRPANSLHFLLFLLSPLILRGVNVSPPHCANLYIYIYIFFVRQCTGPLISFIRVDTFNFRLRCYPIFSPSVLIITVKTNYCTVNWPLDEDGTAETEGRPFFHHINKPTTLWFFVFLLYFVTLDESLICNLAHKIDHITL